MKYDAGTVEVTYGSPIVNGTDTLWLSTIKVGDLFKVTDVIYQIAFINSNIQLTLSEKYMEK